MTQGNTVSSVLTKIAVVGSGISGAVCSWSLATKGLSVTLFDSGRGPGGRMSTRREITEDGKELFFNHGAPYFTVSYPEVLGFVREWESRGICAEWKEKFGTFDCKSNQFVHIEQEGVHGRYVGIPGMNSICKALCREPGVESKFSLTVGTIEWLEGEKLWKLSDVDGHNLGLFKAVVASDKNVVSPRFIGVNGRPPPLGKIVSDELQFGSIFEKCGFADLSLVPELAVTLENIPVSPRFVLMLAFKESISIPVKGFLIQSSKVLSWAHCDTSKPGHSTAGELWVVHSTAEYAERVIGETGLKKPSDATLKKVAEELFYELQRTGLGFPQPFFMKAHRWGSAFPATSIAKEEKCLWDGKKKLAICGDFCVSPSIEGGIVSGLAAASRITHMLSCI